MTFQQFGFAMAVAVLLDATIVRTVLVPATMKLLGNANWYMSKMLNWLPEFQVESQVRLAAVPAPATVTNSQKMGSRLSILSPHHSPGSRR